MKKAKPGRGRGSWRQVTTATPAGLDFRTNGAVPEGGVDAMSTEAFAVSGETDPESSQRQRLPPPSVDKAGALVVALLPACVARAAGKFAIRAAAGGQNRLYSAARFHFSATLRMAIKRQSLQDPFLNALRRDRIQVSMYLVNGIRLVGIVQSFDAYTVLLKDSSAQHVFKHAISTIVPVREVSMTSAEGGETPSSDRETAAPPPVAAAKGPLITTKRSRLRPGSV